jgi:hypothetical protein
MYVEISTIHGTNRFTYAELNELDDNRVGLFVNRRIKLHDFFSENIGFDREIEEISGIVQFYAELQIESSMLEDTGAKVKVIKLDPIEAFLISSADTHLSNANMNALSKEILEEIAAGKIILDDDELTFTAAVDIQAK